MALNQLIYSAFELYGAAAIPNDETNTRGNFGTVATCTTQGFFIYVCYSLSLFYYVSFSVYSFVGILSNFEKEKYLWVEKYIHAVVPIYPLITAFVILSKQGFNAKHASGYCEVSNTPWGCDDPNHGDVPCKRGHLNHGDTFFFLCYIIVLGFPTVVMFFLYVKLICIFKETSHNNKINQIIQDHFCRSCYSSNVIIYLIIVLAWSFVLFYSYQT